MGTRVRHLAPILLALAGLLGTAPPASAQDTAAEAADPAPADAEQAVRDRLMTTWKVAQAGDGSAYAAAWDANTMIKELLADPGLQKLKKSEKTMLAMGLGMGIRVGFAQDTTIFDYERMEVRRVDVDGDRAVAVIRGWDVDDFGLSWRIWLAQRDGEWGIHDAEEMSQGIRISRLMLAALSGDIASGEVPPWVRSMDSLLAAANASAAMDWRSLEMHLRSLDGVELPPDLAAMRSMLRGIVALRLNLDPEEAIAHTEEMVRVFPATVAGEIIRARALLELDRPTEVLPAVDRFLAVTGPDALALSMRGEALHMLGRHEEALEALRAATGDSPGSSDALGVWLQVAEGDEHDEPLRTFKTLRNPENVFEPIVMLLRDEGDRDACTRLYAAMAEVRPDNDDLAYWHALHLHEDGENAVAIAKLRPAIDRFRDAGLLADDMVWPWVSLWLDLHEAAGTLAQAAPALGDDVFALVELGARLATSGDAAAVEEVAARIAKVDPEEPWITLLRADALMAQGKPGEVEALVAPLLESARMYEVGGPLTERRARAFVAAGKALEGYDALGGEASFDSICWQAYELRDGEALLELAARHEVDVPEDELIIFYRLHGLHCSDLHAKAVEHYEKHRDLLYEYIGIGLGVYDSAVRSAVRAGDMEAAEEIALEAYEEVEDYWIALVRILQGDAAAAEPAVLEALDGTVGPDAFLDDPDLEKALASEAMAPIRTLLEERAAGE